MAEELDLSDDEMEALEASIDRRAEELAERKRLAAAGPDAILAAMLDLQIEASEGGDPHANNDQIEELRKLLPEQRPKIAS